MDTVEIFAMGNRKEAESFILKYIKKLDSTGFNEEVYREQFKSMSDTDFEKLMLSIKNEDFILPIFAPNQSRVKLTTENAIKVARELGHEFFERLRLTDPSTGETYLTPIKYLVIELPIRRQAQLLSKKIKIPENNKTIDSLTDQATGPSKGASLSFPELQVLVGKEMNKTIEELIKVRGGDSKAYYQFTQSVMKTGSGSLENVSKLESRVKSVETLSAILKGMHLDNNL